MFTATDEAQPSQVEGGAYELHSGSLFQAIALIDGREAHYVNGSGWRWVDDGTRLPWLLARRVHNLVETQARARDFKARQRRATAKGVR